MTTGMGNHTEITSGEITQLAMSGSVSIEVLQALVETSGLELSDPDFRTAVYFEQMKQDAFDSVLESAKDYTSNLPECWESAIAVLSKINADLEAVGAPGIMLPSIESFASQVDGLEVREKAPSQVDEIRADYEFFTALHDPDYHFAHLCRLVAARQQELRNQGKPLAPLCALPGSKEEDLLRSYALKVVESGCPEKVASIMLLAGLEHEMKWRFNKATEAAWRELLRAEVSALREGPRRTANSKR